ncbi:hypothetical protein Sjap_018861 [Stephania japonica]|uniref:Uncharacterized protein n=1 Tax=Stephania japonica TaxID=461633 RepID=A0AAP0NNN6_9MAGN
MENHQHHQIHHGDGVVRPSLGFPLGTALLLIIVFCLSGVFSCCYHWEKLRSIRNRRRSSSAVGDIEAPDEGASSSSSPSSTVKPSGPHARPDWKEGKVCQSVPVLMPGDEAPTFIALPCPPIIFDSTTTISSPSTSGVGVAPHVTAVTTQLDEKTNHSDHNVENSSSNSMHVRDRIARFGFYYHYNC